RSFELIVGRVAAALLVCARSAGAALSLRPLRDVGTSVGIARVDTTVARPGRRRSVGVPSGGLGRTARARESKPEQKNGTRPRLRAVPERPHAAQHPFKVLAGRFAERTCTNRARPILNGVSVQTTS